MRLLGWALSNMAVDLKRREDTVKTEMRGRQSTGTEAQTGEMLPEAGIANSHQSWEARDDSTRVSEGGSGTCISDFRLPDCERSCCFCCSSAPVCGTLLRQPGTLIKRIISTPFYARKQAQRFRVLPMIVAWELLTLASATALIYDQRT